MDAVKPLYPHLPCLFTLQPGLQLPAPMGPLFQVLSGPQERPQPAAGQAWCWRLAPFPRDCEESVFR